ncbi:MAG: acyl-CoA dehydrogenase family protein [Rhodothermales bacterium]
MSILSELRKISADDRKMIADAEAMLGPEPDEMGFVKNMFWGRYREDLIFPYPRVSDEERRRADALIAELDGYLENEHPSIWIDQNEEVPSWVFERLFKMGVMGMTIPEKYGGLGFGVTSYNRVLQRIGTHCVSTAVIVSAHQSIGCKAIMLFGSEDQKERWLPKVARDYLSAFCLSEPNVGCDAAGQETHCRLSDDGSHYILNGEKKWITSGALSGLFTVMARQTYQDPASGKEKSGITALLCTPDLEGVDIYERNRSKAGIRGTWQARIRFTDVKVPIANRLAAEGKGLRVALTCLNYGRCTLSAGMLGSAERAMEQAVKWSRTRYQFGRPISDFELVKKRIANMAALTYAMDALLYMMTGMLDRGDEDIMVETAATKVFVSEMGWRVVNDAVQIMGGESYMTENEIERIFRDSRLNLIVEGANEVMQSFIFAYGGKRLAENLISLKNMLLWDTDESFKTNVKGMFRAGMRPRIAARGVRVGMEMLAGIKRSIPSAPPVRPELSDLAKRLTRLVRDQSHVFMKASLDFKESIVTRQVVQARISDNFMYLFAMSASLAKFDQALQAQGSEESLAYDRAALRHFFDIATITIEQNTREIWRNADESMLVASEKSIEASDAQPNELFIVPEKSPVAAGTGRTPDRSDIKQFPGENSVANDLDVTETDKKETASV